MGLPRSIRLKDNLEKRVEAYIEKNDIRFPELVNLAIEKFIGEPQKIELEPVDENEFLKAAQKAFKKHKNAMDKLK